MKTYADTGFLVSLYLNETTTERASEVMQSIEESLPIIPLGIVELCNAFHLATFRKQIDIATRLAAWRQFESDVRIGIYDKVSVSESSIYDTTFALIQKYSATAGTRTVDLLHIAAALNLNCTQFLTFDSRQHKVAKAEGLRVRP